MNLSNSKIKLITSIIWWFLTLFVYFSIRLSKGLNGKVPHNINISDIEFTVVFGCFIFGISSWAISRFIDKTKSIQRSFILQIILKTVSLFFVLVLLIVSINLFQTSNINIPMIVALFDTPQMRSIFIFFLFSSILLNVVFIALDIIGLQNTIKLLLGKFKVPLIENRIFLFIDLKDSTAITQKIGHQKYGKLMQEVYSIINDISHKYSGEIYQYVGDEVIISWPSKNREHNSNVIKAYLEVERTIKKESEFFQNKYGLIPEFWSGATSGEVTVIEIGTFKRHITYFGDALNMAARLTSLCKDVNKSFLISSHIRDNVLESEIIDYEKLGKFELRGFTNEVEVFSPTNR
jgi:adenylate cyclase